MNCPFGIKTSKLISDYSYLLNGKRNALDIGCAHGSNSICLSRLGLDVTAVDKDIPEDFSTDNIHITKANILDFKFDRYDIVLALNVLQFLDKENQSQILNKICFAMNKEGVLFVTSFTDKDPDYKISKKVIGCFKENELYNFAKDNGLKIIHYVEKTIEDNHEPYGPHKHSIVELVAQKI